jgi:16S rRNA (guanine(966)-N(2))-methyltransferase RsmD
MRVIAGRARGKRLKAPRSTKTRPTSDLIRAAIFNMLSSLGADFTRVLDLYAGTGALGIEALSRGAEHCDFVERDPAACALIRENLRETGLAADGTVHCMDVARVVDRLTGPAYTLVLADPPYADERAYDVLTAVARSPLVDENTLVLVELPARRAVPAALGPFPLLVERRHGDTVVAIYGDESATGEEE